MRGQLRHRIFGPWRGHHRQRSRSISPTPRGPRAGCEPLHPGAATGQSVGIIGAGPAGLTAAEYLRVAGHEVHVYDRHDRAGGLLTYGIPGFKLEKEVVHAPRSTGWSRAASSSHLGFEVGGDATLDALRAKA